MRNNTRLAMVVTMALCLPTVAHAAVDFNNLNGTQIGTKLAAGPATPGPGGAGLVQIAGFPGLTTTEILTPASSSDAIEYAAEIFGGSVTIPTSTKYAAVYYQTDGAINLDFRVTFTLDNGATFGNAYLAIQDDQAAITAGGSGSTKYFDIDLQGDNVLAGGSNLVFAYKLSNPTALAAAGQEVKMTAKLAKPFPETPVNPERTVAVAKSKQGISATILPITLNDARISVSSGSKQFSQSGVTSTSGTYVSQDAVRIGTLQIVDNEAKASDGETAFALGSGSGTDSETDGSTLTIENGQFAASITSPGKVYLKDSGGATTIDGTVDEAGTKATWTLTNTNLGAIMGFSNDKADIMFSVDGASAINVLEDAPIANMKIDFKKTSQPTVTDTEVSTVELNKIKTDGTECWVFNVPNTVQTADAMTILITNDSAVGGTVSASMWDQEGAEKFVSQPLNGGNEIAAGATIAVTNKDLEEIGGAWTKRGILKLSTTLPRIEVLNLIRDTATNINSNLSTGATGSSCISN